MPRLLILLPLLAACVEEPPEVAAAEVFRARCTVCHRGDPPAGDLDLSADPSTLVDRPSTYADGFVVDAEDPDASVLLAALDGTLDGVGPMPPGAPLDEAERAAITRWIDAVAQDQSGSSQP